MSEPLAGAPGSPDPLLWPTPLVSVLVRSMARGSLASALASVDHQTWPAIELVVVNATGAPHAPLPDGRVPRRLVDAGRRLPRTEAANCALDAALGQWVLFLDDDDTLDPDHLLRLCRVLLSEPGVRAVHGGVRLIGPDGLLAGVLDEAITPTQLWKANRLAIHAVLFERSLAGEGLRFDTRFAVYEDWDFWFQLVRRTRLVHVPGVSATYRLQGDSGTSEPHDEGTSRRMRQPFYDKWLPHLQPGELEALAASAENARANHAEALRQLDTARQVLARSQHDAALHRSRADGLQHRLDAASARAADLEQQATTLGRQMSDAQAQAGAAREHVRHVEAVYAELEAGYLALTRSLSWRVTQPLRAVRGLFSRTRQIGLARQVWRSLPLTNHQRLALRDGALGTSVGRAVARRWSPQRVAQRSAAAPPTATPADKERVRATAEAELTPFLAGTDRIDLRCTTAEPDISVIVVLYNQAGLSRLCLQSLAASEGPSFETLIVDNASTDRVPDLLQRVDGATVLSPGRNLGFLLAVNAAAAQARGRHLVLLNNDAMVEPRTLQLALQRLRADDGAAAVGGPILLWDGRLQEAGSIIWRDGSCLGYGRGDSPDRPEYAFVRDVDYCSGAFLMVRRAAFEALGGLDTAFVPAYYEESDFCARLWEQGHRIVYDPQVRIRHFEFASEVSSGWALDLQRRHRALFVERHPAFLAGRPEPSAAAVLQARARLAPGRQRVLVIDDRVPLPWLGQGYPRAAHLVRVLAAEGHAVTHYPLQFPNEDETDVRRALPDTVEVMLGHGLDGLQAHLQGRSGLYDTLIVSRPHNMQVVQRLAQRQPGLLQGARVVYDAEAMFTLRDIAKAALDGRALTAAEQRERIAGELALARGAQAVMTVSTAEAAHYRTAGYDPVLVLGHELETVDDTPGFAARADLLFVGALTDDDTPNADSMRWFAAEVWPLVSAALGPEVHLHVAGPCEAPSVRSLAGPRIHVLGRVDRLDAVLDRARVFIVPTRYAAGIPHKAHEAAARGLPMVVSPLIAQQLGWQDIVSVGHDAESFARHCVSLMRDPGAWQRQREAVIAAVRRDCSAATFRRALSQALGQIAPDEPPHAPTDEPTDLPADAPTAASASDVTACPSLTDDDQRTADLWGRDAELRSVAERQLRHWSSHPVTAAEINRLISGAPDVGWVDHLRRTHFPARRARGLSLGCGSGAVVIDALRLGIVQQMEGVDLSAGAVAVATTRAAEAGLQDRAAFRAANVNDLALQGPYDLIVFEQSLHHVDALGAVLDRCHEALAADGVLALNEYVGPDRFQWSDEAERLMNAVLGLLPESRRRDATTGAFKSVMRRVSPQEVVAVDPSEAIHSADILAALATRFDCVELRPFGGTLLQFLLADIAATFDPADERDVALLRLMTLLETELIRCGAIGSDFVYAVYRRRRTCADAA